MNIEPLLWGSVLWDSLFSCTWKCELANLEVLNSLVFEYLPLILPCAGCREHYSANKDHALLEYDKQRNAAILEPGAFDDEEVRGLICQKPSFSTWGHYLLWLWALRNEVNKKLKKKLVSFSDVVRRYRFSAPHVNEESFVDCMMLISLSLEGEHLPIRHDNVRMAFTAFSKLLPAHAYGPTDAVRVQLSLPAFKGDQTIRTAHLQYALCETTTTTIQAAMEKILKCVYGNGEKSSGTFYTDFILPGSQKPPPPTNLTYAWKQLRAGKSF